MGLFTSASNAATLTLGVIGSLTNAVASGNGYTAAGRLLAGVAWTVGASAKSFKSTFTNPIWTGTGGTIPNIKFAVTFVSGASAGLKYAIAVASLTSAQFTLSQNNTLTLQLNALGCFTMQ